MEGTKKLTVVLYLASVFWLFAQTDEGGPDGFGYYYQSTQEPGDSITFAWIDPAAHNLITNWTPNPDDGWASIHLPYRFPFYGDTLDSIVVCSNGFLQFPSTFTNFHNQELPATQFCHLIALFWDDLNPANSGGVFYYHDSITRSTVITFLDVTLYNQPETVSAQVVLGSDGVILMNYLKVPTRPVSATVGIQGNHGNNNYFLQYLYNGNPPCHLITNRTSIRFFIRHLEHDVGVYRLNSPEVWFPANSQCPVQATVKNYGLNRETFTARALLLRNRPPYDTIFHRTVSITNLAPGDTYCGYFGDLLTEPNPDSYLFVVQTELANDQYRRNDTARQIVTSFAPEFGKLIACWDLTGLGSGMNLAGICYVPDSNRFYFVAHDSNRILSFPADNPLNFRFERFQLQNFFGDDIIWGIAWDQLNPGFWITHSSNQGPGSIVCHYAPNGTFTGDSWNIESIEPGVWFAGIDQGEEGTFYAVAVGGANRIYHLDFNHKQVLGYLPGPVASWRACSYLGDQQRFLFSGGWNDNILVQIDRTGNPVQFSNLPDLADLDIYKPTAPAPDSFIWAYATTSNYTNTIVKVSLGVLWRNVGLEEHPEPLITPSFAIQPNPCPSGIVTIIGLKPDQNTVISLYDAIGRRLTQKITTGAASINLDLRLLTQNRIPPGLYFLTIRDSLQTQRVKITILNP